MFSEKKELINVYRNMLFRKGVDKSIWSMKLSVAMGILFINVGFHSLFSLQVFIEGSYPFLKIINISDTYYYLIQAMVLFPISIYVYLIMTTVIYLLLGGNTQMRFEDILKICIITVSIPIGIFFALPCIILYLILGYKMAAFVPIFSTFAFVFAFVKLNKYLQSYFEEKRKGMELVIIFAMIVAFILEFLIIR